MRQIRRNTFETNSSSTHSLAVPKQVKDYSGKTIYFGLGTFGWEFEEVDAADYLWTALCSLDRKDLVDRFFEILNNNNILYKCEDVGSYKSDYYIDHLDELIDFIEELFKSEEKTLAFIFDGLVYTGNDNADESATCFIHRNDKFYEYYDWEAKTFIKKENPYYNEKYEQNYDWYYKYN